MCALIVQLLTIENNMELMSFSIDEFIINTVIRISVHLAI